MRIVLEYRRRGNVLGDKWWGEQGSWVTDPEEAKTYESPEVAKRLRKAVAKRGGVSDARLFVTDLEA